MKFVMSNRRAGKFRQEEKLASRHAIASVTDAIGSMGIMSATTVSDNTSERDTGRRSVVMEGAEGHMKSLQEQAPEDVIIEPYIEHHIDNSMLGTFSATQIVTLGSGFPTGTGQNTVIKVTGNGQPLAFAKVYLILRPLSGSTTSLTTTTGADGIAAFEYSALFQPLRTVVVPYADFWPMQRTLTGGNMTVPCPPLPNRQRIDWWHRQTGYTEYEETAGQGIKIGVIDTGFGPHGHLNGTPVGAFIDNQFDPNGGADVDEHGTHVAGTIGGRPGQALRFSGMAPGVELFAARVFSGIAGTGAGNPDIAAAIDFLSREKKCDLINMSLGAPVKSKIIEDAIKDAFERGTLCICAAANSAGPVNFPAAFPDAVAISAAGQLGNAPEGSVSAGREPTDQSLFGINHMFFANFSCFGPQIDSIAPGVGIVAPIPERNGFVLPYGALDGTSMASPVACGTLARALAKHPDYTSMSRDMHRATLARSVLNSISKSIGLDAIRQGRGIPME